MELISEQRILPELRKDRPMKYRLDTTRRKTLGWKTIVTKKGLLNLF